MHQNVLKIQKIKNKIQSMRWMAAADTDRTRAATNANFNPLIIYQINRLIVWFLKTSENCDNCQSQSLVLSDQQSQI